MESPRLRKLAPFFAAAALAELPLSAVAQP